MVKHTQTNRTQKQFAEDLFLSVFDHFMNLALKGLIFVCKISVALKICKIRTLERLAVLILSRQLGKKRIVQ